MLQNDEMHEQKGGGRATSHPWARGPAQGSSSRRRCVGWPAAAYTTACHGTDSPLPGAASPRPREPCGTRGRGQEFFYQPRGGGVL